MYANQNRILAQKMRQNYERVDPSSYGYNLPDTYSVGKGSNISYQQRIQPPVISTINDRNSGAITKPTWWG